MASAATSNETISKSNAGFPPYLDFNKLRTEGIDYLGKLSGQLWTDFNVHDPGITILEELCYALLDLGYRTNLPVEDILAANPAVTAKENNFFTPAQILSCNPLTIPDYRKLLIDIAGVRNAWLVPANDIRNICRNNDVAGTINHAGDCEEFLNGIYHVFIETELNVDTDFANDDPVQEDAAKKAFITTITERVKTALMSHRNLCEDFADIFILCKLEMGVCASIEIEDGADAENVYTAVANALRTFFSPVPVYYTLQQLLDKGKSMEEIFAGRPYSKESFGFIDTAELEAIGLKKEIHTSDVYNAIFAVEGVKKISKLRLRNCGKNCVPAAGKENNSYWKFHLPENHIPEFSISCSGFEFTRKGVLLVVDQEKFESQLELGWLHTGKVLYSMPSPYLDAAIPAGIYHDDLDSYYSIQNDFPVVYGIGEGDLSDNVSNKRKAQALQLKGYLFFFDQMLANYLSQLKNIRQLFSFRRPADKKEQHTYFLNTIATVPELSKLLRFGTGDQDNGLGTSGTLLAFPVAKTVWQLLDTTQLKAEAILNSLNAFTFSSLFGLYESTDLLRNDLVNEGESTVVTYATADGYYLYTIESSASDFIIVSKKISSSQGAALRHAASVQYAGVFENNYRSFLTADNLFTFDIELNMNTYTDYLGILVENDELYVNRRTGFLTHLLSRFAEQFTDFVLLNWKPEGENNALQTVEQYLSCYPDLSRNRGRAYNYLDTADAGDNISGFEKKVKALAGIPTAKNGQLCPFTVEPFDESYVLDFSATGITDFRVMEKFDLMEDAVHTAASVIAAMGDQSKYTISYSGNKKEYQLLLDYGGALPAVYHTAFSDSYAVEGLVNFITGSFPQKPAPGAVVEHSWNWAVTLKDNDGQVVRTSTETWQSETGATNGALKLAEKLNDTKKWKTPKDKPFHGKLFYDKTLKDDYRFIDTAAFNIVINDAVIGKPGKFSYDVLDKESNSFKITAHVDFTTAAEAAIHCHRVLVAAADAVNYTITQETGNSLYRVVILLDGNAAAGSAMDYPGKQAAENAVSAIVQLVKQHTFSTGLLKTPASWKFKYLLGYNEKSSYTFYSESEYASPKAATGAVQLFYRHLPELRVETNKDNITLGAGKKTGAPVVSFTPQAGEAAKVAAAIRTTAADQHQIARMHTMRKAETLQSFVKVDGVNAFGTFVYRLVDKNNVPAVYSEAFADEATAKDRRKNIAAVSRKAVTGLPGICLGGDVVEEVYDAGGILWYRYQIMFYNIPGLPGQQLVLFESAQAFASEAEAIDGFNNQYLQVLLLASDPGNYGKYILSAPVAVDNEATVRKCSVAFIPAATLKILQDSLGAAWNEQLIKIVAAYPVKTIDANSVQFAALFCTPYKDPVTNCAAAVKDWKYYFSIPVPGPIQKTAMRQQWISTAFYDSPDAAMEDFRYFSRLLLFTGNYFVDCGCSETLTDETDQTITYSYRLFIHEVLAQSIDWFQTEALAWGGMGIEKFICAAQSGPAFKNYQRRADCCYSFYTTCGNGLLEHPCTYDTTQQRDKALENLYQQLTVFVKNNAYGYTSAGSLVLEDVQGKPFARVTGQDGQTGSCERLIVLAEQILLRTGTVAYSDGILSCTISNGQITIQSAETRILTDTAAQLAWIEEWSQLLWYWACYFPVGRTKLTNGAPGLSRDTAGYKYCIEIKLPGFTVCDEEAKPYQPCDGDDVDTPNVFCNIAWKSTCCYNSCEDAMAALKTATDLLLDKANYHSVFDCDCNSFGITLHTLHASLITVQTQADIGTDIIAVNPQCYETPGEVCAANALAQQLINSQGMHLAEHILLRPSVQDDCNCREKIDHCSTACVFPNYIVKATDACSDVDESICFRPGSDPYSFIATIVLPAWSDRFRLEANRLLLENLLYREAPAHVLLRILWLRPVDFCGFEKAFTGWRKWTARMDACNGDFSVCRFLELLFSTPYDCLDDCNTCLPCTDPHTIRPTCADEDKLLLQTGVLADRPFAFLNQVNDTFCFDDYCQQAVIPPPPVLPGQPLPKSIAIKEQPVASEKVAAAAKKTAAKARKTTPEKDNKSVIPQQLPVNSQLKAKSINTRFRKYKADVALVLEQTAGNTIAGKTDSYLSSQQADAAKLAALITELIQNEKGKRNETKQLNKKQQLQLAGTAICFYLDKISFNGKSEAAYKQLSTIVTKLVNAGFDMKFVFKYWNAAEVIKAEPGAPIGFVRRIITSTQK